MRTVIAWALSLSAVGSGTALDNSSAAMPPDAVIIVLDLSELSIVDLARPAGGGAVLMENYHYLVDSTSKPRARLEYLLLDKRLPRQTSEIVCSGLHDQWPSTDCTVVEPEGLAAALAQRRGKARVVLLELAWSTRVSFSSLQLAGKLAIGRPHERKPKLVRREFSIGVSSNSAVARRSPARDRERMVDLWLKDDAVALTTAIEVQFRDYVRLIVLAAAPAPNQWCRGSRIEYYQTDGFGRGWTRDMDGGRAYLYTESENLLALDRSMIERSIRARAPCPIP